MDRNRKLGDIRSVIKDAFHFMMEWPENRILKKKKIYPILLQLNDQHKYNDGELFVHILTTKQAFTMDNLK